MFTGWIYGRPLRLPRASPHRRAYSSSRPPLLLRAFARPRKNLEDNPKFRDGNGKINRNANSSDAYGCAGRIILGEFRELETRPPVIARANEFRWSRRVSSSSLRSGMRRAAILKVGTVSTPCKWVERGCAWKGKLPLARVIYVIWRWTPRGIVFGTTAPPRRLQSKNKWGNINVSNFN